MKSWTKREIKRLKGEETDAALAHLLGRSSRAVFQKRQRLGIGVFFNDAGVRVNRCEKCNLEFPYAGRPNMFCSKECKALHKGDLIQKRNRPEVFAAMQDTKWSLQELLAWKRFAKKLNVHAT